MSDATYRHRVQTYPAPETTPTTFICRRLYIPDDPRIIAAVNDVLAYLALSDVWEASDGMTELDMQALMSEMFFEYGQDDCS